MSDFSERISTLALAAEQSALLRGALTSGFLARMIDEVSVEQLAASTGMGSEHTRDLCMALESAGIVVNGGPDRFRLSATFAPLLEAGADIQVADFLRGVGVRERLLERAFAPDIEQGYMDLSEAERTAIAAWVTFTPSAEVGRQAAQEWVRSVPEWKELLDAGAVRHLELGCGLSGAMLCLLQDYPKLTAVGVDLAADLIEKAAAQAVVLGVDDRFAPVVADARTFTDLDPFDAVFWSQFFYPADTRAEALANAYQRLRPGGLLMSPLLVPPASELTAPDVALDVLLFRGWGIPIMSADEVAAEMATAGFEKPILRPGPMVNTVVARRP
jgi:SAM-dependent methyltransferase